MRIRGMILFALVVMCGVGAQAAPGTTTTNLTVTAGGAAVKAVASGTVITLTASVKYGVSFVKPGLVRFCDASISPYCEGLALLGTAQLTTAKSTAVLNVRLGLGTHTITAVFAGTAAYKGSVSAASSLEVQGLAGSTTALTVTPTDATGSYSLAATVTSMGSGAGGWPATGVVTFPDAGNGGKSLGSATLAAGSGGYGLSFLNSWSFNIVQAVGDWNGDGYPDVIEDTTYSGGSFWYVELGGGNGKFVRSYGLPSPPAGAQYASIAGIADFNGDGIPDVLALLTTGYQNGPAAYSFEVLQGGGDGSFTAETTYPIAGSTEYFPVLLIGDFNGDGWPDVIAPTTLTGGSSNVNTLGFYAGKGTGSFAAAVVLGTGLPDIAVGDFNGDGKPDLIGSDANYDAVVALGNGDGSFQTPIVSSTPYFNNLNSSQPVIADFNGDGVLDVGGTDGNFAYIAYGNGDGTFGALNSIVLSGTPVTGDGDSLYVADLNADGLSDLMTINADTEQGLFYLNNGDGTFSSLPPVSLVGGPYSLFGTADFNGDGLPDLLGYAGYNSESTNVYLNAGGWVSQGVLPAVTFVTGSGKHLIKASFGGDAGTLASSSSESAPLWATKIATTLALTSSVSTVSPGGSVKLTATLTPSTSGSYSANGELVGFYSGSTLLGSAALANGVATLTTTALPGGVDAVQGIYSGDNSFSEASSAAVTVTVTQTATTLTLTASTNATTAYAAPGVTFTATLSPYSKSTLKTDGEVVTFYDGKTVLGTGVLASGVATLVQSLPVGSQVVTAVYAGDLNFAESTSAAQTVTVTKAATGITLTPSPATVGVGNTITLTATVTPTNTTAYPNFYFDLTYESVYFYQGKTLLGVGLLYAGTTYGSATASITTTTLPLGTDTLTAVYGGDSYFTGVTSAAQKVNVTKDATTLSLSLYNSCSASGCTFIYSGDGVTLAASLAGNNNNGLPTGEAVKFYNGKTLLGTATLSNSYSQGCLSYPCAAFTTYSLPNGAASLTAVYAGDGTFAAETSNADNTVVGRPSTKTTLSATPQAGLPGTAVTLTATTTSSIANDYYFNNEAGADVITFYAGSKVLGTAPFTSADSYGSYTAVLTTSGIPNGTNSITAVFGGDNAYKNSTSNAVTVTLNSSELKPAPIAWVAPAPVKAGTPLTAKQLNATATVAGTFTYAPAPGTVLAKGSHALTATFKPSVKAMREGYVESSKSVTLKVE